MSWADALRILLISMAFLVVGFNVGSLYLLHKDEEAQQIRPAPLWVNVLFLLGIFGVTADTVIYAWSSLGAGDHHLAVYAALVGVAFLAAGSFGLVRHFRRQSGGT